VAFPTRARISQFFGRTISEGAAFAMGTASAPALRPILQELTNETWKLHPVRPPDAGTLANGVAQGQVDPAQAAEWASEQGIGAAAFEALVHIADTGPGVPAAFDLWRRGLLTDAQWETALKRQAIEPEWVAALKETKVIRLDPAVVANAVQQGHVPNEGILPPPVGGTLPLDIPLTTIQIDALAEAAAHGYDEDRLKVITNLAGLPPGAMELLNLWNRGIITEQAVDAGIREGHIKTKWTEALKHLRRPILSGVQAAGLWLRDWISESEAKRIAALSGWTAEDVDLLYKLQGRPPSPTQMWTMWARQARGPFGGEFSFDDFAAGIRRSNIRTEYVEPLWDIRFNYPSLFQMRQLVSSGVLPRAEALDILHKQRYPDALAVLMVDGWLRGGTARTKELTAAQLDAEYEGLYISRDQFVSTLETLGYLPAEAQAMADLGDARRVKGQRDKTVEAIRKAYLKHTFGQTEAEGLLVDEGIPAEAIGLIMHEWNLQLETERKTLTPTQIKRAYVKGVLTRAEALAALEELDYSPTDAAVLLDTP